MYKCLADLFDCFWIWGVQFLNGTAEMLNDSLHNAERVRIYKIDCHARFAKASCAPYSMQVGLKVGRAILVDRQVKVDYQIYVFDIDAWIIFESKTLQILW